MISIEVKHRILAAIKVQRAKFTSDTKHAVSLGISPAQYSRIMKDDFEGVLSDANWASIARKLEVQLGSSPNWQTAKTPVYSYITGQLNLCQENSMGGMICDKTDIGKTYSAKCYVREHKHAIYVDCSQVKTKRMLVLQISKEFGLASSGLYRDIYADLIYYLRSIEKPIVILDEAGDLDYNAFLELKALFNATEGYCGWYMMGADGLRKKIENNRLKFKVGYPEIFSRYGSRYQKVTPDGKEATTNFSLLQATLIAKANGADDEFLMTLKRATELSLRRIQIEISKKRRA
jgi:DNA transposition AAA+ family ATPase